MARFFSSREWMDRRISGDGNSLSQEFIEGVNVFIKFASNNPSYAQMRTILCPCARCKNTKQRETKIVARHLCTQGFKGNYYVWTSHGETCFDIGESSVGTLDRQFTYNAVTMDNDIVREYGGSSTMDVDVDMTNYHLPEVNAEIPYHDSVFEAFHNANQPLYAGCVEGISQLFVASRLMKLKTDYNLPETCIDEISQTLKDVLPSPNSAPASYYETKKLTRALGLPLEKIDVCVNNCMLYWKGDDKELLKCRFCNTDRYLPRKGKGKGKNIPRHRMFYMPITERLKRLYQFEMTAGNMRWHAEHSSPDGEMHHPSDGAAWKHFNEVYPEFSSESRNIYLGLSTDGFNPIGMNGEAHSVWPVIVTPYNLPPGMCMKREYFFLSILVPGPKHPKRSLDIYLQPLIEELKMLWTNGVDAYDVSKKQNFRMRAVLMWTISDFPAYEMVSGWMTHGRLACPYCLDDTKSFWLPNDGSIVGSTAIECFYLKIIHTGGMLNHFEKE